MAIITGFLFQFYMLFWNILNQKFAALPEPVNPRQTGKHFGEISLQHKKI
jgi:hypothetical protein